MFMYTHPPRAIFSTARHRRRVSASGSSTGSSERQHGQVLRRASHRSAQRQWNRCPHGRSAQYAPRGPGAISSRQIAHGAPSPAAWGSASTAACDAPPLSSPSFPTPTARSSDTTSAKRRHLAAAST
uniref:Uncharacterized protein n=1 Tax=Arundo donax TaxID=35708 RepID=A0A0A9DD93_ARUDO